jgi:hypothetical protein
MKQGISKVQAEKLAQGLKDLRTRGDDELRERWRNLYGTEPPRKIHCSLLIPAIAYRMQENALGGLRPSTRRHLVRVARDAAGGRQAPSYPGLSPKPGTVLVRDLGRSHPSAEGARRRNPFSWQTIQITFRGRARHHWRALVGSAVLRPQIRS